MELVSIRKIRSSIKSHLSRERKARSVALDSRRQFRARVKNRFRAPLGLKETGSTELGNDLHPRVPSFRMERVARGESELRRAFDGVRV